MRRPAGMFYLVPIHSCSNHRHRNVSVDWETEATMQSIIEGEFASQTVISVIHRLRYIEKFDRVALMRHGRLVEFDSPKVLLEGPSEFQAFYRAKHAE